MKNFNQYLEIIQEGKIQNYKPVIIDTGSKSGRNREAEKVAKKSMKETYSRKSNKHVYSIDGVDQNEMKTPKDIFEYVLQPNSKNISVKIWDFSESDFNKIITSMSETDTDRITNIYDSIAGGYFSFLVMRTQ
jgi:hypothetical protein